MWVGKARRGIWQKKGFGAVFRQHEATMLLIEADTGRIAEANPAAERFYGYPGDVLRQMTIQQINVLSPEAIAELRAKADAREQGAFAFPHRLASGAVRTVEVHSSPINVAGRRLLFSVIHDISERARMQEALHEESTFNRNFLDSLSDTVFVLDPATGKAVRWNRAFRDVSGYSDEEIAEKTAPGDWVGSEDRARAVEMVEAAAEGAGVAVELSLLTKDGRRIPTEYVARRLERGGDRSPYVVSIGRDVTTRKRAQEERLRFETQLQQSHGRGPHPDSSGGDEPLHECRSIDRA
ncbi:MAG: PAS domain-containing protein, partial [Sandaracinaceae bacterium]